jgi:hypothetical protein
MEAPSRGAAVAVLATPISQSRQTDFESRRPCFPRAMTDLKERELKAASRVAQTNRRNFRRDTCVLLRTVEANMPFSLGSYLIGIGTVVGALAFGFGGGVLLTHTPR